MKLGVVQIEDPRVVSRRWEMDRPTGGVPGATWSFLMRNMRVV